MFDAHAHLHFEAFDDDLSQVVERACEQGLRGLITADYDESRRGEAESLAIDYPGIWRTVGLHPWAVLDLADEDRVDDAIEGVESALSPLPHEVCALGELGLDWYRDSGREFEALQTHAFRRQLAIARDMDLPIVIHSVRSNEEVLKILEEDGAPKCGGIVHGFVGSTVQADRFLKVDVDISVGTSIARGNSAKLSRVLAGVPRDRVHIETDCPSRPPDAAEVGRNEPAFLRHVVARLAEVWETDEEEVARVTEENTRRRFSLSDAVLTPRAEGRRS